MMTNETNLTSPAYNTTKNETKDGKENNDFSDAFKWVPLFILLGILLFNTIVIVLLSIKKKKSRMSFFVLNLAVSDISIGIFFVLPEVLFNHFKACDWNQSSCEAYGYLHMFSFYASTNAIIVLTLDRLYVIVRPMSTFSKRLRYRLLLSLSGWGVCALVSIYHPFYRVISASECIPAFPDGNFVLWFEFTTLVLIPVIIIITSYGLIIAKIHGRRSNVALNNAVLVSRTNGNGSSQIISSAKIKTIKLLLVIVIVYFVCWLPIVVGAILFTYQIIPNGKWIEITYTLAPMNSLANPLVFLVFNWRMFRKKKNSHAYQTVRTVTERIKDDSTTPH